MGAPRRKSSCGIAAPGRNALDLEGFGRACDRALRRRGVPKVDFRGAMGAQIVAAQKRKQARALARAAAKVDRIARELEWGS